jgi:hypothetical protein
MGGLCATTPAVRERELIPLISRLRDLKEFGRAGMDEPSKLPGLEAMPPEDQKAIGATLSALLGGFSKRDAAMLEAVYSDDADWVNAFGTVGPGGQRSSPTSAGCSPTPISTPASWSHRPRAACAGSATPW